MVSAAKIGSVVPSQLIDAVTDRLPDRLPEFPALPDLPLHVGDVTDRVRELTGTTPRKSKSSGVGRFAIPLLLAALGAGIFLALRSRRSSTEVASTAPSSAYAHT